MFRKFAPALGVCLVSALCAVPSSAHDLTRTECAEGGEFIRNAALARDAGVTREFFVNRMTEDLAMIQSFPPHLRWFVQDAGDEKLLSDAVKKVFDDPKPAPQHEAAFIGLCLGLSVAMLDR